MNRDAFLEAIKAVGLDLDVRQLDLFESFESNLYEANQVMNLTRVPRDEAWLRHFMDSLLFQDLIPVGANVADLGTGPGFPAWPLACARPDLNVTAVDSSGKMLGFLRQQPLPNLQIELVRAEEWGVRERFDVVTGRAVAPFSVQLELSAPLARIGGTLLPMRTPTELEDVRAFPASKLGLSLTGVHVRRLPGTDIDRLIPEFQKVDKTPNQYPRTWAEIKRSPIG